MMQGCPRWILLSVAWSWHYGFALHIVGTALAPHTSLTGPIGRPEPTGSTCPARTVNYITHRLPQQCFKTSWADSVATTSNTTEHLPSPLHTFEGSLIPSAASLSRDSDAGDGAQNLTSLVTSVPTQTFSEEPSAISSGLVSPSSQADAQPASASSQGLVVVKAGEVDGDSPLDIGNFLSFEEWKKKNLARVGQSPESLKNKWSSEAGSKTRHRPGYLTNALDSLGDDSEIDLDFGRFRSAPATTLNKGDGSDRKANDIEGAAGHGSVQSDEDHALAKSQVRSKHAGTTSKERFNYASFDCAATILKANPEAKGPSSILVENKDSYMLNECAASNKFFIVELCEDILIDTIVLANFEFFSSIFRTVRISVSDRYPVKIDKWKELGTFEARNSRDLQLFSIQNPLIWARYVRFEFLSHFGTEYYCPVSLLRVHGTTMMEEFKHQEEAAKGEEDNDDDVAEDSIIQRTTQAENISTEAGKSLLATPLNVTGSGEELATKQVSNETASQVAGKTVLSGASDHPKPGYNRGRAGTMSILPSPLVNGSVSNSISSSICQRKDMAAPTSSIPETPHMAPSTASASTISSVTEIEVTTAPLISDVLEHSSVSEPLGLANSSSTQSIVQDCVSTASNAPLAKASGSPQEPEKPPASSTSAQAPNPTTQESFFKTVHKRLQLLEANATLSLQYIEEQSQILRDAFIKVERRQLNKTTTFLENLNATVLAELHGFRQQYDQIWQSTVLELENQREQSQKEAIAVSARLNILADQVVFQKRMMMVQTMLLLLCLGLIMFARGASSNHLELPIMQNVISKTHSTFRLPFESPFGSPPSTRPNSSGANGKTFGPFSQNDPRHYHNGTESPQRVTLEFSPPTPTSSGDFSGSESKTEPSTSPDRSDRSMSSVRATERDGTTPTEQKPASPTEVRRTQSFPPKWQGSHPRDPNLLRPSQLTDRPSLDHSSDWPGSAHTDGSDESMCNRSEQAEIEDTSLAKVSDIQDEKEVSTPIVRARSRSHSTWPPSTASSISSS